MSTTQSGAGGINAVDLGVPAFPDPIGRALGRVSVVLAILGVLIICGLAVMLCVTIFARKMLGWQVAGDHELVQIFAALSMSMLFPWCHLTGGNVIVDLLTSGLPRPVNKILDRIGSLLLSLVALLLAWRTGLLAEQTFARGTFTPLLAWPVWIPQVLMLPGLLLTFVVGTYLAISPHAIDVRDGAEAH